MTTVMQIDEPRPRGSLLGERPMGGPSPRPNIFSDARRATAGSMCGIWCGSKTTKARCRIPRKIKRNRLHGRLARLVAPSNLVGHCPAFIAPIHGDAARMILQRYCALALDGSS
jgi:hypothetical protein